jgi:hypothetical protein
VRRFDLPVGASVLLFGAVVSVASAETDKNLFALHADLSFAAKAALGDRRCVNYLIQCYLQPMRQFTHCGSILLMSAAISQTQLLRIVE